MAGKLLVLTPLLLLLTACRQEQLMLPVAHAAGSEEFHAPARAVPRPEQAVPELAEPVPEPVLYHSRASDSCYAFMLRRPRGQRATAVQARLRKADEMAAAFGSQTVTVDLVGDHANILDLQFPVVWPAEPYSSRVSSVIEGYFSTADVQDYMCNSGFAQVRLSARGLNDRRLHALWSAHITTEGLVKDRPTDHAANQPFPAR